VARHHTRHVGRSYARKKTSDLICEITIGIREARPIREADRMEEDHLATTPSRAALTPPGPLSQSPQRSIALVVLVGVLGFALLLFHIKRYPAVGLSTIDPAQFSLPQASKLLAMLRSLSWLALINLSALCLGALFERWLPLSAALSRFRLPFQLGIGLALLGLGILLLAALHLLHVGGFATLLVAPPALWILFSWNRLRVGRWGRRVGRPSRAVLWSCAAYVLLLGNAFIHAFGPDFGWDALTYHLAFPERYLFENGISMTPFSHLSGYIAGTEMLYALALFLDGPSLAVLIHREFGALTLVALWQLGSVSSRRAAILAPLFLIADPLFQLELGWAYSDLSLGFYSTLAAIAFCAFIQERDGPNLNGRPDENGRNLVYAGIACGMCCATRYLGAGVVIALCAVAWLPPRHTRVRENLRACLAVAGLSALVMLPWMVRNAVFTGNPITPLFQSLFYAPGNEYIPAIVMQQSAEFLRHIGMGRDLWSLLALPWNLTMSTEPGVYSVGVGAVRQTSARHSATRATTRSRRRVRLDLVLRVPRGSISASDLSFDRLRGGCRDRRACCRVTQMGARAAGSAPDCSGPLTILDVALTRREL